jgi:hypothetical protein
MAFDDVFGQADAVANDLYARATEDAPGAVDADLTRGRLARKLSTDPWKDYEERRAQLERDRGYQPGVTPLSQQKPSTPPNFSTEGTPVDATAKKPNFSTEERRCRGDVTKGASRAFRQNNCKKD